MSRYGTLFKDIQNAIFDLIHTAVNTQEDGTLLDENDADAVKILKAKTGAIKPDSTYIEFDFLTGMLKKGHQDELLFDEENDSFKLTGQREFSVTVSAFGESANEMIALVQQSLDSPVSTDILRSTGLAIRSSETVADKDTFLETSFEQRAVLDIRFGIVLELLDAVSRIEHVEITDLASGETVTVDVD